MSLINAWQSQRLRLASSKPTAMATRKIPREFDLTPVQGHPRSSILVSMETPYVTSY